MQPQFYYASFIACFFVLNSFAQKQNVYFLKNDGRYVDVKDSADFVSIVREPDSGSVLYNVLEYYLNGNPKLIGKSSGINPLKLEGITVSYYTNGIKKQIINYETGYPKGLAYDYYPNGKLYRALSTQLSPVYGKKNFRYSKKITSIYDTTVLYEIHLTAVQVEKINSVFDSIGVQSVKDGYGYYKIFNVENRTFEEEGQLKNNKRTGIWRIIINKGKFINNEEYSEDGDFIRGTSADENGHIVDYTTKETLPNFSGEESAFVRYVFKNVRLPSNNTGNSNIHGLVLLSFVVEKDGSLTGIKIDKNLSNVADAEVVRVLTQSPKWNPGLQHGIPVRVAYTMPINFTLNGR